MLLAPSERVVVDVLSTEPGELTLEHRTPERTYRLAAITVDRRRRPTPDLGRRSSRLCGPTPTWSPSASGSPRTSTRRPDKTLAFVAEMDMGAPEATARRLRVPDAPRGRQRGAGQVPEVRDEAARASAAADQLRLPDAPGGGQRPSRPVPEVRDEAVPANLVGQHAGTATTNTHEHATTHDAPRRHDHAHDAAARASSGRTTWSRSTG